MVRVPCCVMPVLTPDIGPWALGFGLWTLDFSLLVEAQVKEQTQEVKDHREGILALGDPGDRLDVHGMDREQQRCQPRRGHRKPPQHPPQDYGAGRMQQHIGQMIAAARIPHSRHSSQKEVEVSGKKSGSRVSPDVKKPARGLHIGIVLDPDVVIPNKGATQRRPIHGQRRRCQRQREKREVLFSGPASARWRRDRL